MMKFILLFFVFLGAAFYEMSGGGDFDPEAARAEIIATRQAQEATRVAALPEPQREIVAARANTASETEAPATTGGNDAAALALNLVAYDAVTERRADAVPAPPETPSETEVTRRAVRPLPDLPDVSLEALERSALPATGTIAFAGRSLTADSQALASGEDTQGRIIRTIKGTLVNMRSGPGTDYEVVDQLPQATRVEILSDTGNGWVELRPVDGGPTGWIAAFLLDDG